MTSESSGRGRARWFAGPDSAFSRWLDKPSTPMHAMPAAISGYWISEAVLHWAYFDGGSFWHALFAPDPHELWMRLVVAAMLLAFGFAWRKSNIERHDRIVALQAYQARLRELTGELASADGEERYEIAKRLHEDVHQQLAAARMFVASVDHVDEGDASALASASRILERAAWDLRDISEELSPRSLGEYGLTEALESLARRLMRRTGVSIDVVVSAGRGVLQRESALVGFQLAAEVLDKAARECTSGKILVTCCDSAEGDVEIRLEWSEYSTHDFFSAVHRIDAVGGSFEVDTARDGTLVRIRIPRAA